MVAGFPVCRVAPITTSLSKGTSFMALEEEVISALGAGRSGQFFTWFFTARGRARLTVLSMLSEPSGGRVRMCERTDVSDPTGAV